MNTVFDISINKKINFWKNILVDIDLKHLNELLIIIIIIINKKNVKL